jgi:hypothetical protein
MKTTTTKELRYYYIGLHMNTLSTEDYKQELERTRYIFGCTIKPKRTENEALFMTAVENTCYSGNTTCDLFIKRFGFSPVGLLNEKVIEKTGLTYDELKTIIAELTKQAGVLIDAAWETNKEYLLSLID